MCNSARLQSEPCITAKPSQLNALLASAHLGTPIAPVPFTPNDKRHSPMLSELPILPATRAFLERKLKMRIGADW